MNIVQHIVTSIDNIQALANQYFGDAGRWRDIVDFNNIDYPYIVTDPNFQAQVYASGSVTVTRAYTSTALTIPKNTTFFYAGVDGYPNRLYVSTQAITLPVGTATAQVPVQCTIAGAWGNVPQGTITAISTTNTVLQTSFSSITNTQPFTNGVSLNVRFIGDSLLIPLDGVTSDQTPSYDTTEDYYTQIFGADLAIGSDGDLWLDPYGDIGSVTGTANLAQAVHDRLVTAKNALAYHPEYGSLLEQFVAMSSPQYADRMIALAVQECLQEDDRVASATVTDIQTVGTQKNVTVSIVPIENGTPQSILFTVPNLTS